ncbi:MAG: hypothetical protein ACRD3D_18280 [Terriglobia bacterium]
MATQADVVQTYSRAAWHDSPPPVMANWEAALWEFARLLSNNPQVLAVVADDVDSCGSDVTVWTYLRSSNRADWSPIIAAEAEVVLRYPPTFFDFNVVLRPTCLEEGDLDGTIFYYKSDYGNVSGPSKQGFA